MHLPLVAGIAAISATAVTAFPTEVSKDGSKFKFPLSNGFPGTQDVAQIEQVAGGALSNSPGPASVHASTLVALRLVAFNELSEVAFFPELLQNITREVPGYECPEGYTKEYLVETFAAIQAQEEIHALTANLGLEAYDTLNVTGPIQPCEYQFPVQSLDEAIALANIFTDMGLGVVPYAQAVFAAVNDTDLISLVGLEIGQEGEQNGFFRLFQKKRPSSSPFLTIVPPQFAWSALNQVFVSSCPQDITKFGLGEPFGALTAINSSILPGDQTLTFEAVAAAGSNVTSLDGLELVYINGANLPVVEKISGVKAVSEGIWQFSANFPQATHIMDGLTIAAVTRPGNYSASSFAASVAAQTVFAPALIEVS